MSNDNHTPVRPTITGSHYIMPSGTYAGKSIEYLVNNHTRYMNDLIDNGWMFTKQVLDDLDMRKWYVGKSRRSGVIYEGTMGVSRSEVLDAMRYPPTGTVDEPLSPKIKPWTPWRNPQEEAARTEIFARNEAIDMDVFALHNANKQIKEKEKTMNNKFHKMRLQTSGQLFFTCVPVALMSEFPHVEDEHFNARSAMAYVRTLSAKSDCKVGDTVGIATPSGGTYTAVLTASVSAEDAAQNEIMNDARMSYIVVDNIDVKYGQWIAAKQADVDVEEALQKAEVDAELRAKLDEFKQRIGEDTFNNITDHDTYSLLRNATPECPPVAPTPLTIRPYLTERNKGTIGRTCITQCDASSNKVGSSNCQHRCSQFISINMANQEVACRAEIGAKPYTANGTDPDEESTVIRPYVMHSNDGAIGRTCVTKCDATTKYVASYECQKNCDRFISMDKAKREVTCRAETGDKDV